MRRWLVDTSDAEMRGVGTRGVGIAESAEVNEAADGAAVAVTRGDRLEIDLTFDVARSTAHRFGIDVRASSNRRERTRLLYDRRARRFRFDRSRSGIVGGVREVSLSAERLRLHLFIDRSSVELFVNDGERSLTARVYPDPGRAAS